MPIVPDHYRFTRTYKLVRARLVSVAQSRGLITYKEIAAMMGLSPRGNYMGHMVGQILGEISEDEVNSGRPMLSAVVVRADGKVGEGFFTLARELGLMAPGDSPTVFWRRERVAVYAQWRVGQQSHPAEAEKTVEPAPGRSPFAATWSDLQAHLKPGLVIANWTYLHDHLGNPMTIVSVSPEAILVRAPKAEYLQTVSRRDFEAVWECWPGYKKGSVPRTELIQLTRYSKYIISILHWYETQKPV